METRPGCTGREYSMVRFDGCMERERIEDSQDLARVCSLVVTLHEDATSWTPNSPHDAASSIFCLANTLRFCRRGANRIGCRASTAKPPHHGPQALCFTAFTHALHRLAQHSSAAVTAPHRRHPIRSRKRINRCAIYSRHSSAKTCHFRYTSWHRLLLTASPISNATQLPFSHF